MNQKQYDWIEKCKINNEPRYKVIVHEKPYTKIVRSSVSGDQRSTAYALLVEIVEKRKTRTLTVAVLHLGDDGVPIKEKPYG